MKSRAVSLKPPLLPLVRGVRMARVMTTSSGFWDVLVVLDGGELERRCLHGGDSGFGWSQLRDD